MNAKLSTFLKQKTETLSVFGANRYHDWAVLFMIFVIVLMLVSVGAFFLYRSTTAVVSGKTEPVATPSTFERTRADFESLSVFVKNLESAPAVTVPRNPALR